MNEAKLTRNGIAYDLNLTPYKAVINYEKNDSIVYSFSSQLYKDNFLKSIELNRNNINNSLSKRFGFIIEQNKIADIKLYNSIEKRGFLIEDEKERYTCLSIIKLDGMNLIQRN